MKINYLKGDATKPVVTPAYIVHVVNTAKCWGAGFVIAVTRRFGKGPEATYRLWTRDEDFRLGRIQIVPTIDNISVVNMLAQDGFPTNEKPCALNFKALTRCLKMVYTIAEDTEITVHMPRIGCGLAGGTWDQIEPIIAKTMTVDTYVYDFE